jgi:hypothetical protein
MRILVIALILGINLGFSQRLMNRKTNLIITSSVSKQRMDYFLNFGAKTRVNYFEIGAEVGLGIERTFFQQTFSPHIELHTFYNFIQQEVNRKQGIVFGPGIILSGTTYKTTTTFNYGDILLAYQFCVGQKWKFFHHGGYGIMFESFQSNQGKIVSRGYNYCFKIGISYALHI